MMRSIPNEAKVKSEVDRRQCCVAFPAVRYDLSVSGIDTDCNPFAAEQTQECFQYFS